MRNVEETDDENLPEVQTRIADVEAQSAQKFLARLKRETCFLLHLSEGLDAKAREHFLALNFAPNKWAITPQLTGIHCAALKAEDFTIFGQLGADETPLPFCCGRAGRVGAFSEPLRHARLVCSIRLPKCQGGFGDSGFWLLGPDANNAFQDLTGRASPFWTAETLHGVGGPYGGWFSMASN